MDIKQESLNLHERLRGKLAIASKYPVRNAHDLALVYTPGVAEVSKAIAKDVEKAYTYTSKGNLVAIVTDGSRVLGLGNIGPEAAMPVMEGKAVLFKQYGNVDAFPICLRTQDADEIIAITENLSPTFGGINVEDIDAPRCFYIEETLNKRLAMPVFHDDQYGTGIVVLAALINAAKLVGKNITSMKIAIAGAGAAGIGIAKLLHTYGVRNITLTDSKAVLHHGREDIDEYKKKIIAITNPDDITEKGAWLEDADFFVGTSGVPGLLKADDVKKMAEKPIIFALTNPDPEIMPDDAKRAGAAIVGTGRSDTPNQINNSLAFPGVMRGALDARKKITISALVAAAEAIAALVDPTPDRVVPSMDHDDLLAAVSGAVRKNL